LYRLGHTKVNQITFYKLTSDFPPLVWKHPIENNSKFSFLPNPCSRLMIIFICAESMSEPLYKNHSIWASTLLLRLLYHHPPKVLLPPLAVMNKFCLPLDHPT
jgi:hypothetical protein